MDYKKLKVLGSKALDDVSCPLCFSKTLVCYFHSDIPALEGTVVCGRCGSVYKPLLVRYDEERKEQRVVGGTKIGMIKRGNIPLAAKLSGLDWADDDKYYELLAEPITIDV